MRLIDADAIPYEPLPKGDRNYRTYNLDDAYEDGYNDAMVDVRNAPTIERKTGTWTVGADMPPMKHRNGKPKKFWPSLRYCSVCGHEAFDDSDWGEQLFDWCPYCGADLRGEQI